MASMTNSLLRKLLVKYAHIPNAEAVLIANELDESRIYDTAVAVVADTANIRVGSLAYAVDTEDLYMKGATTISKVSSGADPTSLVNKVTLDFDDITTLVATQFELVPAVAGKVNWLQSWAMELVAGSEVLTESVDNMIINYIDDSGVAASGAIEATGFLDQAVNSYAVGLGVAIPIGTIAQVVNTALVLDNTGDGEYAGNATEDALLNVWCRYTQLTVAA